MKRMLKVEKEISKGECYWHGLYGPVEGCHHPERGYHYKECDFETCKYLPEIKPPLVEAKEIVDIMNTPKPNPNQLCGMSSNLVIKLKDLLSQIEE